MLKFRLIFKIIFTLILFLNKIDFSFGADLYKLDPAHTNLTWQVDHFGLSRPSGKFTNIEGKIIVDQNAPQNSSVDVIIRTNSINTGFTKLDNHLKSSDFFDVEKFPTATFKSTSVVKNGTNNLRVSGILTIKEINKIVNLDVKINKIGKNPITQNQTIGMSITGSIKRSDFGINYGIPGIGNEVKIMIESEAIYDSTTESKAKDDNSSWQILNNKSKIEFIAMQNSNTIKGEFKKFGGKINFDNNNLDKSSVEIEVETTSLDMSFAEALETAKNPTWLAIATYPKAIFKSNKFVVMPNKNSFSAKGTLELKGKTMPIALDFYFKSIDKKFAYAIGSATIKRSDFGIGDKNSVNANGINENIIVNFEIQAQKKY